MLLTERKPLRGQVEKKQIPGVERGSNLPSSETVVSSAQERKNQVAEKKERDDRAKIERVRKKLYGLSYYITPAGEQQYRAEFIPQIRESLQRCQVDLRYVNPVPLGAGEGYVVYSYAVPGETERVIKIAKRRKITSMTMNRREEQENYMIARNAFPGFIPETSIHGDLQNPRFYCIIQEKVEGKTLTNTMMRQNPQLRRQVLEIARLNRELYETKGLSLDFAGWRGFLKGIGKLFSSNKEVEADNMIVDKNNHIKLIDYETIRVNEKTNIFRRVRDLSYRIGNRWYMYHYFRVLI